MWGRASSSVSPDSLGAIGRPHGSSSSLAGSLSSPLAHPSRAPDAASNASTALGTPACLLTLLDAAW
jgi:hypothetical protein